VPKEPCGLSIRKRAEPLLSLRSNGERWLYIPNTWKNITEGLKIDLPLDVSRSTRLARISVLFVTRARCVRQNNRRVGSRDCELPSAWPRGSNNGL